MRRAAHRHSSALSSINVEKSEKVVINVSGCKFQTWRSTLRKHPDTLLGSDRLKYFYDWSRNEYFLDRDPNIFRHVLSFYQVGKLHLSHNDCLDIIYEELSFYGISTEIIHECCWNYCNEMSDQILQERGRKESAHSKIPDHQNFGKFRKGIWNLFSRDMKTWPTKLTQYTVAIFICLSVLSGIIASLKCDGRKTWEECYHGIFEVLDWLFMIFFTIEYLLRIYSSTDVCGFFKDKINILDLIAIIPFYIDIVIRSVRPPSEVHNTDFLEIFRVLRGIRIIRLARHSKQIRKFGHRLHKALSDLGFLYFAFFLANIFFASILYTVETLQGHAETFKSIPESMWYTVVTMMTLGYGDIVPQTVIGKTIGAFCCIFGIIIIALPVPILQNV